MKKIIFSLLIMVLYTLAQPVTALSTTSEINETQYQPWTYLSSPLPKEKYPFGIKGTRTFPAYTKQIEFITENLCDARGIDLYRGNVYYVCPSGDAFWADVLVPSEFSPLFMYFKNRERSEDEYLRKNYRKVAHSSNLTY